jgi:hypothetical protein
MTWPKAGSFMAEGALALALGMAGCALDSMENDTK